LNRDPIEEKGSLNLLAYVGNNSINLIDLLGLELEVFPETGKPKITNFPYFPGGLGGWGWCRRGQWHPLRRKYECIDPIFPDSLPNPFSCGHLISQIYGIFLRNSLDLPGGVSNDKFAHCYFSCRLTQDCGSTISKVLGYIKEIRDAIFPGDNWSNEDIAANNTGIGCGKDNMCVRDNEKKQVCQGCCESKYGSAGGQLLP